jgi:hypothetical protein
MEHVLANCFLSLTVFIIELTICSSHCEFCVFLWLNMLLVVFFLRDCLFGMHRRVLQKLVYASEATGRGDLDDWEDTYVTRSWKNLRNKVCRRKSLKR